jgi:hypothetical protein
MIDDDDWRLQGQERYACNSFFVSQKRQLLNRRSA